MQDVSVCLSASKAGCLYYVCTEGRMVGQNVDDYVSGTVSRGVAIAGW